MFYPISQGINFHAIFTMSVVYVFRLYTGLCNDDHSYRIAANTCRASYTDGGNTYCELETVVSDHRGGISPIIKSARQVSILHGSIRSMAAKAPGIAREAQAIRSTSRSPNPRLHGPTDGQTGIPVYVEMLALACELAAKRRGGRPRKHVRISWNGVYTYCEYDGERHYTYTLRDFHVTDFIAESTWSNGPMCDCRDFSCLCDVMASALGLDSGLVRIQRLDNGFGSFPVRPIDPADERVDPSITTEWGLSPSELSG